VYVSVDTAANQSVLEWEPSPELDTQGYIIVWSAPGGNTIIDTVYGRLNTSYQWLLSQAGTGPEAFTIAAIDTCERGNPPSPNTSATLDPHATVFLSTAFDPCAATIRVVRTPYVGWPVDHYELFVSVDNGPFALLASLPPDLSDQLLPNVQPDHAYCFVMQAYGAAPGQFSRSNKTCRSTTYPAVPQWNYLRNVTVLAPDRIQITDSVELAPFTRQLVLERSANGAPWKGIDSVASPAIPVITFLDEDVATAERSYSYRVAAQDSCGQRTTVSNTGNSILLTTDPGLDGLNRLYWNGYVAWAGNITAWNVYRSIAGRTLPALGHHRRGYLAVRGQRARPLRQPRQVLLLCGRPRRRQPQRHQRHHREQHGLHRATGRNMGAQCLHLRRGQSRFQTRAGIRRCGPL
jgi:hypothetical protein